MSRPAHEWLPRRGFRRDESGGTAIEFALVAPVLCFALLSIFEIGALGMMSSGLDNAVIDVARKIRTGRSDGPTSASSFEDQVCANLGGNPSACHSRLVVSVEKFSKFYDAGLSTAPPSGAFNKGGPGDIIIVKVDYNWPLMSPFLATAYHRDGPTSVTLGTRLAFKNEPYK